MNIKSLSQLAAIAVISLVVATVLGLVVSVPAPVSADNDFEILPIDGTHYGKTYDGWAEEWHKWILKIPTNVNPMFDKTGKRCGQGQEDENVWFLTGVLGGGNVNRKCDVPEGKALFFPVYNYMWFPFPSDPPMTDEEKAYWEGYFADYLDEVSGWAKIDGVEVENLADYRAHTTWFSTYMPDNNIIDYLFGSYYIGEEWPDGWPAGDSGPHYNDGVYLMLAPLDEGRHTIEFEAFDGQLRVKYRLEVGENDD